MRSCVTYLIQAGRRSILLPSGSTSEILWAWSARRTLEEAGWVASHLDLGIVRDCDLTMLVRSNCDLEDPKGILLHGMRVTVPTVYTELARVDAGQAMGVQPLLKSPMRKACCALGAHSRYTTLLSLSTFRPNISAP